MTAVAALFLVWLQFPVWALAILSLVLVLPSVIIYVLIKLPMHPRGLSPETLHTQGLSLDILAPVYDRCCPKIGLGRQFRQETLRQAELKNNEHILDVGCGTGILTRLAAKSVGPDGRAVGIDPAAKMLAIAKKNAEAEKSLAEFKLAAIEGLPFEKNSFDCVLSSLMLHHLPPGLKDKGLSEVFRVLKPGGRFVLVDVDKPVNPLWWIFLWPLPFFWPFTKDQMKGKINGFLSHAGFHKVNKAGNWMGFLGFWKAYKP